MKILKSSQIFYNVLRYTEAKFKGDYWLQPPDDDEPVYYSDLVVFGEKQKLWKL